MTAKKLATYAWKTSVLAEAIKQQTLLEREQFLLIFTGQVAVFISAYIGLFMGANRDWITVAQAISLLIITMIGIPSAYRSNGGDQGKDFVRRFCILSVPLGIKLSLVSWMVFYALGWVVTIATLKMVDSTFELSMKVFEFVWNIGLTSLFYLRLAHWIRVAREQ